MAALKPRGSLGGKAARKEARRIFRLARESRVKLGRYLIAELVMVRDGRRALRYCRRRQALTWIEESVARMEARKRPLSISLGQLGQGGGLAVGWRDGNAGAAGTPARETARGNARPSQSGSIVSPISTNSRRPFPGEVRDHPQ